MSPAIPSALSTQQLRLLQILHTVFQAQARDVMSQLSLERIQAGQRPRLGSWVELLARAVQPSLFLLCQQGALQRQRRIAAALVSKKAVRPRAVVMRAAPPRRSRGAAPAPPPQPARLAMQWNLLQPKVLDSVAAASFAFAESTNATAVRALDDALEDLRDLLAEGLERGDALSFLARKVQEIFRRPDRAYTIAATEASRAMHQGGLLASRESGIVQKKAWLASPDACAQCLELDGVEKDLDEPFVILPGGGPYAVVQAPPLHPRCFCTLQDVI